MAFRERTTFVIGAGASAEFGLPVGTGLATEIKKTCAVRRDSGNENEEFLARFITEKFARTDRAEAMETLYSIKDGIHTAVSIDAFIHRNSHKPVGRL